MRRGAQAGDHRGRRVLAVGRLWFGVAVALCASGCPGTPAALREIIPRQFAERPPSTPASVTVLFTQNPRRPFRELALIRLSYPHLSQFAHLQRLREEAAQLGAHAVIHVTTTTRNVRMGGVMFDSGEGIWQVEGIAVVWR